MNRKNEITSKILALTNPNYTKKDFSAAKHSWWKNPRTKEQGGLQLTDQGFEAMIRADIKSYKVRLEDRFRPKDIKTILWLDNYINCPFWFERQSNSIMVFDERTAVQIILFSGNINKMLRSASRAAKQTENFE